MPVVAVGVSGGRRCYRSSVSARERRPALVTEARIWWVDRSAIGADTRERLAAVLAEPGVGRVGRLAIRTDHRRVNPLPRIDRRILLHFNAPNTPTDSRIAEMDCAISR